MEKKKERLKRVTSAAIMFPIVAGIFIFANNYIMDIAMCVLSIFCLYEYFHCFKSTEKANPSSWLGYISSVLIIFTHLVSPETLKSFLLMYIPICLLILFAEVIITKGKKNIIDVAVTMLGICYIPFMIFFFSLLRAIEPNGRIFAWYVFIAAWGSDVFAYLIGKNFGKHKFTPISPKKSIEGSIAGIVGAVVISVIYSIIVNAMFAINIPTILMAVIVAVLAVIGQVGDLAASSIKRYCGIKDFSELIPGHGGMLDRFDSVIFIIPFAYAAILIFVL